MWPKPSGLTTLKIEELAIISIILESLDLWFEWFSNIELKEAGVTREDL